MVQLKTFWGPDSPAKRVHDAEELSDLSSSKQICKRSRCRTEHNTSGKSGYIEYGNVGFPETVIMVELESNHLHTCIYTNLITVF